MSERENIRRGDKTVNMEGSSKQAEQMPQTDDVNNKMRRSFSWDRAFFTNDGFLDADELSSMIEGCGNDEKHQLEEIENLEAKLFQEFEDSNKKSTGTSNINSSNIKQVSLGKRYTQTKKVTGAGGTRRAAPPVKTQPTRSNPVPCSSGSSPGNNVKSSAILQKRSISSKTGSKTPPGIATKNKVALVNARLPKTSPVSPISPGSSGSSSSTFSVNRR